MSLVRLAQDLSIFRNSPMNSAWRAGKAVCPDCQRFGCRGQCGCTFGPEGKRCAGCSAPLEDFTFEACEHARASRARIADRGDAARKAYRDELLGAGVSRVSWGECIAQVERAGCPHLTAAAAKKPEPKKAIVGARQWFAEIRTRQPMLVLSGLTGAGKSVAAAHVAARYAELRKWWVDAPSGGHRSPLVWLMGDELARLALIPDNTADFIAKAEAAEFLVVDEVGTQGAKAGQLALAQLIARRADSGRLTVITTNANSAELSEPLGAHVVDRLKRAHVVKSNEPSMRGSR